DLAADGDGTGGNDCDAWRLILTSLVTVDVSARPVDGEGAGDERELAVDDPERSGTFESHTPGTAIQNGARDDVDRAINAACAGSRAHAGIGTVRDGDRSGIGDGPQHCGRDEDGRAEKQIPTDQRTALIHDAPPCSIRIDR